MDEEDIDWGGADQISLAEIQALMRKGLLPCGSTAARADATTADRVEPKLDIKLQGGRLVNAPARPSKRQPHQRPQEKIACEGSAGASLGKVKVMGVDPARGILVKGEKTLNRDGHMVLAPVSLVAGQLDELSQRQDLLAEGVMKALDHQAGRMEALEDRPTPFWHLGKWQKSCLMLFVMWGILFLGTIALGVAGHLLKLLSR